MLLLDASGSMLAEDFELNDAIVSRFEVLRRKTAEFINNHPNERIGAVAFAGAAYVLSAPTSDHANLLATLDKITPGKLGADGTAIGSAIVAGYAELATEGSRKRILILATDGDNNTGFIAPFTAAEIAGKQKIVMLVIGLGRSGYANFPVTDAFGKKSYHPMKTTVDEAELRRLADVTAGRYRVAPDARTLADSFHEFEAVKEKCAAATFTASIPESFTSSFGTASVVGDKLVLKGLPVPASAAVPQVAAGKTPPATPSISTSRSPKNILPAPVPPVAGAAAPPSVSAALSRAVSCIGDPVELAIKIRNSRHLGNPPDIAVDGLQINYASQNATTSVHIENGNYVSESTISLLYQVIPQRNGSFTIPAVDVEADGQSYHTAPVLLTVQPGSATDNQASAEKIAFAEIVPASPKAKVGEPLSVQIRLGVVSNVRWQPKDMPVFLPEGFICGKMAEPKMTDEIVRNGADYDLLTFKASLTPLQSGHFKLGPVTLHIIAQVPSRAKKPFLFDDIFNDTFFTATRNLTIEAPAVTIDVQP